MFAELASGQIFGNNHQARQILPQLARQCSPGQASGEQLTKEFLDCYHCIHRNLNALDILSGADCRITAEFLTHLHDVVSNIHQVLATAIAWHDVLPYTALSLDGLRHWRGSFEYSPSFALLRHLNEYIEDIETWLSFSPPKISISGELKEVAMNAMKERSDEEINWILEYDRAEGVAKYLRVVERHESERQRQLEEAKRQLAQLTELTQGQANPQLKEQRTTEVASSTVTLQEAQKKKREEEEDRKEEESVERERQEKDKRAAELAEQQRLSMQRAKVERERRAAHDAIEAEREQLRTRCRTNKAFLKELNRLLQRGHVSQAELVARGLPLQDQCHATLIQLWSDKGDLLRDVDSQQLTTDPDIVLDLDFVLTDAQIALVLLKLHKCPPGDIVNTGWDLQSIVRLQGELMPHTGDKSLHELKADVDCVCEMVQDAQREADAEAMAFLHSDVVRQAEARPPPGPKHNNVSYNLSQQTSYSQSTYARPLPMEGVHTINPLLDPNRTELDENGLPIPDPHLNFLSQYGHQIDNQYNTQYSNHPSNSAQTHHPHPNNIFSHSSNLATFPRPTFNTPQPTPPRIKEACRYFKRSFCSAGSSCTRPHIPCPFFLRDTCRYNDYCKGSHDPWFLEPGNQANFTSTGQDAGGDMELDGHARTEREQGREVDPGTAAKIAAARAKIPCKDGKGCVRRGCAFMHEEGRWCDA